MNHEELERVISALSALRVPLQRGEYDLHRLAEEALAEAGLPFAHEVPLAPRCRIDLMCGAVGIEMKRGKPNRAVLLRQLSRYAACPQVEALIAVCERNVDLPDTLCGKPLRLICLNRLWGIAL